MDEKIDFWEWEDLLRVVWLLSSRLRLEPRLSDSQVQDFFHISCLPSSSSLLLSKSYLFSEFGSWKMCEIKDLVNVPFHFLLYLFASHGRNMGMFHHEISKILLIKSNTKTKLIPLKPDFQVLHGIRARCFVQKYRPCVSILLSNRPLKEQ